MSAARKAVSSTRLPHYLTREHVLQAISEIDSGRDQVPPRRRSTKFVLRHGGREYPPKYLICRAHVAYDGNEWPNKFGGGPETNNYLIGKRFEIWRINDGQVGVEAEDETEESTFPEGKRLLKLHQTLERDTRIAKAAKNRRLRETGDLTCDACGFSYSKQYGDLGVGYIEAHHVVPVSELKGRRATRIDEIALVCSNCHRMLHRNRPWLSISELKRHLNSH